MITRNLKTFIETIAVDSKLEDIFSKDQDVLEGIEESIIANAGSLTKEPFYINKRLDGSEVLLDGHTRRLACLNQLSHLKEDCEAIIITLDLPDSIAEELWIRSYQIKRRNLSKKQTNSNKLAIGALYNQSKKDRGGNNRNHNNEKSGVSPSATHSTSKNISKEFGLGESTIRKYGTLNNQIEEMAENLCPKKLTNDENDKEAYKEKIATQFTSGNISGATIESMSKVSGSPLHQEKVKEALQSEDINKTWKELKSKPLAPPTPPSQRGEREARPEFKEDLEKTKEDLEKLLNSNVPIDVNTNSYNSVKKKIELLTKQPEFKEDGATPTDTAIFLYEIRKLTSDYFRNRMNAFNIIKKELNNDD